jgi:hypothetical protein
MKTIILNDTSGQSHAGCILTMQSFRKLFKDLGIEIITTIPVTTTDLRPFYEDFEKADFLTVNGEGSIHHNKRGELIRIAKDFPSILTNCVYEDNVERKEIKDFKAISCRESYAAMQIEGAKVVPDICFYNTPFFDLYKNIEPRKSFGRTDSCDRRLNRSINIMTEPGDFAENLRACERVCTGRFHGIVFCAALNIPFSAYASNTWKNEGLMYDMGMFSAFDQTIQGAEDLAPYQPGYMVDEYVRTAPKKIKEFWKGALGRI